MREKMRGRHGIGFDFPVILIAMAEGRVSFTDEES